MERKIMTSLINWKKSQSRKPLILKGVRQCGKTYILKEFGKRYYKNVAYFNFEQDKNLARIFDDDFDIRRIIVNLSAISKEHIEPGETLIIFDEIQECPKALTALKYFNEFGNDYHIVSASSLLGIALHQNTSFPVGKVDFLTLYPLSFDEFLLASGNASLLEYLNDFQGKSISLAISPKIENLLKEYYIVGGMPEVVSSWLEDSDFERVTRLQKAIISSYELDFVKHAKIEDFPKLSAIWSSIPNQLAKENSKFFFSHVKKGYRAKDLEDALRWLIDAGLIYKVAKIEKPNIPISSYADPTSFKVYLSDVGILRALADVPPEVILDASSLYSEFKGSLSENFVLNELVKANEKDVYYWANKGQAEVDFVLQLGADIIPIEVKAERNVKARSLAVYKEAYSPKHAVRASLRNEVGGDQLFRLPLYLIYRLKELLNA